MLPFPLHWHTEPLLVWGLLGLGWFYALFMWPFRGVWARCDLVWMQSKNEGRDAPFYLLKKSFAFYAGLIIAYLALGSPLDQLGEDCLFSCHMVQHLILALLVPYLFYKGVPQGMWDRIFEDRIAFSFGKVFFHPAAATLSFIVVYGFWHIPALYEWALIDKRIHILEHLMMGVAAMQVFWILMSPSRRLERPQAPVQILSILFLMVGQFPVLGALTLAEDPLYTTYLLAPKIVSWSPLQDQVLGGLVMNGTMMVVFFCFFARSFYRWFQE
jgi:putative membrane protein